MSLNPNRMQFVRQSLYIPVSNFQGFVGKDSVATGNPDLSEWASSGVVALGIDAAQDSVSHLMAIPSDWDRNHDIDFYVSWTTVAAAVGDRTAKWKVFYKGIIAGTTVLSTTSVGAISGEEDDPPVGVASTVQETSPMTISAGDLTDAMTGIMLVAQLTSLGGTVSAWTSYTEAIGLLGLRIEYTPRYGRGKQSRAKVWTAD